MPTTHDTPAKTNVGPRLLLVAMIAATLASCGNHTTARQLDAGLVAVDGSVRPDAALPSDTDLWFAPNIGSVDMLELFENPDAWPSARDRVRVFQLYLAEITAVDPGQCQMCGPNLRPGLIDADVFAKLESWGISLAAEAGAVKPNACAASDHLPATLDALSIVADNGGKVHYLTMDEPYRGGVGTFGDISCGLSMQQAADQTTAYIEGVLDADPTVEIGDVEPYPLFTVAELEAWIQALQARGVELAYFHLDVDLNALKNQSKSTTATDLAALRDFVEGEGIPFGVIFIGNEWKMNQSDDKPRTYYETATAWAAEVHEAISAPSQAIVQSWVDSSGGGETGTQRTIPDNLPETGAYTHTRIINDVWAALFP